jgi:hypothetical protein
MGRRGAWFRAKRVCPLKAKHAEMSNEGRQASSMAEDLTAI